MEMARGLPECDGGAVRLKKIEKQKLTSTSSRTQTFVVFYLPVFLNSFSNNMEGSFIRFSYNMFCLWFLQTDRADGENSS